MVKVPRFQFALNGPVFDQLFQVDGAPECNNLGNSVFVSEILDSYEGRGEELVAAKGLIWNYELVLVMVAALKQDFNKVVDGWNVANKLSKIVVTCCIGHRPTDVRFFIDKLLVDIVNTLLILAVKLQTKYVKTSMVLEDTKSQLLLCFRGVFDSLGQLLTSYDMHAKHAFQSASFLQMLLTDDVATGQRVMNLIQSIVRLLRGFFGTLDTKIANQILDELIFKLTATHNTEIASSAAKTLLNICESHSATVQLIISRYKGIKVLLRKWSDKGAVRDFQLLLDIGNLQTARLAKDARSAMIIQAWWKSYQTRKKLKQADSSIARLQRTFRVRKMQEQRRREEEKMEAELQHMLLVQRKYNMRQLHKRQLQSLQILPASEIEKHLAEEQNCAAIRIQSVWKGYATQRGLHIKREKVKEIKAAVLIQRTVRRWLDRVHAKKEVESTSWLRPRGLTDDRRVELQEKIIEWRENHRIDLPSRDGQEQLHRRAQDLIRSHAMRSNVKRANYQHIEALLGQLDMDANLLLNMPRLSEVTDAELRSGAFKCRSVPLSMKAAEKHGEELRLADQPWWRKFNNNEDMDDEQYAALEEQYSDAWKLF